MKKVYKKLVVGLIGSTLLISTPMIMAKPAGNQKHADWATKVRKATFTLLGNNMGALGGMAQGKVPFNAEVVERNSLRITQISAMVKDYTAVDTSGFEVDSDALPKVWKDRADFEAKADDLSNAAQALHSIATSGSEADVKKAIGALGKTCKGCHDSYKLDDD